MMCDLAWITMQSCSCLDHRRDVMMRVVRVMRASGKRREATDHLLHVNNF